MRRIAWIGALLLGFAVSVAADNWPAWRGPTMNGYSAEKNLPVKWSATENVTWKLTLPGPGNSTPIVWGERVFITQSLDPAGQQRAVMCFNRRDGKLLWQRSIPFVGKETTHKDNPYCSASPVTDGKRVIASMGSAGVVCYDFDGKQLWYTSLGKFEHIWGNAAAPALYKDLVILNCGPGERTFLIALNKRTGKEVWRVDEPGGKFGRAPSEWLGSWSTPIIASIKGRDEVIVSWSGAVKSYDPRTGKLLWTCTGLTALVYTSPLVTQEVIVAMSGFGGSWIGIETGGNGDITATKRLWRNERATQRIGSGVIIGNHVYIANAPGTLQCTELKTGKTLWNERLGGGSWSSLVYADGRLYVVNRAGETHVVAAKPTFEPIARNPLDEPTQASIAVSDGQLFIRTHESLWCIGKRQR